MPTLNSECRQTVRGERQPTSSDADQASEVNGSPWTQGDQGWLHATLTGALDLSSALYLDAFVCGAIAGGAKSIELDLAGVTFLDAAGLRALLDAGATIPGRLLLAEPSGPVRRLACLADACAQLGIDAGERGCLTAETQQGACTYRYPPAGRVELDQPLLITSVQLSRAHAETATTPDDRRTTSSS